MSVQCVCPPLHTTATQMGLWYAPYGVTYALNLTDRFSVGFNGKFIQEKIANNYANGIALDLGTLFETPYGFRLGTSISNFGPKMKMTGDDLIVAVDVDETIYGNNESVTGYLSTDEFDLPLILRVGVSDDYHFGQLARITWAIDVNSPNDNTNYVNTGIECGFMKDIITLNFGFNSSFMADREKSCSYGIGIHPPKLMNTNINIVFSFENLINLGTAYQLGMHLNY